MTFKSIFNQLFSSLWMWHQITRFELFKKTTSKKALDLDCEFQKIK